MTSDNPQIGGIVPTAARWTWSTPTDGIASTVVGYPTTGGPTKSGVMPVDLVAYLQIPLQQFTNPPVPIVDATVVQWIRWAEDEIEIETGVRLCQTWIAAPAANDIREKSLLNIGTAYNYQQLGVDYDYAEAPYDFFMDRAKDDAWLYQRLRWRPVKGVDFVDPVGFVNPQNNTGVKNLAMIYPLLTEFFRMPQNWFVEDQNRGLVRMVPATNTQMLPLFMMQLSFMGFSQTIPGALWFQYTAGLTANDYNAEWSFMRQLVLARAGVTALGAMQTSVNFGVLETQTQADGLSYRAKYSEKGAFSGQITRLEAEVTRLTKRAKMMGGGINLGIL